MPTATAKPRKSKTASSPGLGAVARVIVYVTDFKRAVKFYTETLGLAAKTVVEGWAELETAGTEIDLHHGRDSKAEEHSASIGFRVADVDATVASLKSRGVKVGKIFSPCGGLRCASFRDPDGNALSIEGR